MNKQTLALLSIVTLVMLVAALQMSKKDQRPPEAVIGDNSNPALFPSLTEQLDKVSRIEINSPEGVFSVSKNNAIWGLDSKQGYPVASDKVAQVLNGMASLNRIEAKTQKDSLYHKLELQDRSVEGAKSTQVSLNSAEGSIASVLIGKTSMAKTDTSLQAMYVRLPKDKQTWLAHSPMRLEKNPDNWLDKDILKIAQKRIQSVSVSPASGEPVHISKASAEDSDYQFQDLPAGAKVEKAYQLGSMASILASLSLEDVKAAKDAETPAERNQAVFKTFDGLSVTMDIHHQAEADQYWASLSLQADPTATAGTANSDSVDVVKEATDINAKTQGWLYQLTNYKMENLLKPRAELFTTAEALANRDSQADSSVDGNALADALANAGSQAASNPMQQRQALDLLKSLGQ